MGLNANAKKWVEALRSGRYRQTTEVLRRTRRKDRDPAGYCCLGVACEVFMKSGGHLDVTTTRSFLGLHRRYNGEAAELPRVVVEWLGLERPNGDYAHDSLSDLNDIGVSFEDIAATIAAMPEGLFTTKA